MRRVYKNLCPATISASVMAANMWKNSLKNVESDNNKIFYETLLDCYFSETVLTFWIRHGKPINFILWKVIATCGKINKVNNGGQTQISVGRHSSVGIATRYGLDGAGIKSQCEAKFSTPVQNGPGAHPASYTIGKSYFSLGKVAEAWRWPSTPSSAEVKQRVKLYFYSSSGPSYSVLR